ncbi:MAG: efflux RND transporter periplasmic adaptor subunit [Gammaproteobacteria bacterium]|nr:efflux RND transporter periplasmic adaptor subunit [Gammaproteobacteria bacterium]
MFSSKSTTGTDRSAVERAAAAYARAKAEEEHARFERGRREKLIENRMASQAELESAIRTHRIAQAALTDARVALEQAQRDLERTRMRAPYRGLVRSKSVDQGQFVSRGSSVAQIYASDFVEVRLPIADRQLAFLDVPLGQRGEIRPEHQTNVILGTNYGGEHHEWIGKLVRTEAEIDSLTRMVYAVARIGNEPGAEKPPMPVGLFVSAEIYGREVDNLVVLPRAAIRNESQVLVVDDDNRLRFRSVDIFRYDGEQVFIKSGLERGERVNLSPLQTVVDGMRVRPVAGNRG